MEYEYALKYPARGEWVSRILLGGSLLLAAGIIAVIGYIGTMFLVGIVILPFALVPRLAVDGYYVRVLRHTTHNRMEPPGFEDVPALFVDGLRFLAISVVYALPVLVVGVAGFGTAVAVMAAFPDSNVGEILLIGMMYVGTPILGVLGLIVRFVSSAAMANFAYEDDLWAAFDFGVVSELVTHKTWVIAFVIAWGISLASGMLTMGGIGYLLVYAFFVEFYVGVVTHCIHGQALAEIRGDGVTPPSTDGPGQAIRDGRDSTPAWERIDDDAPGDLPVDD